MIRKNWIVATLVTTVLALIDAVYLTYHHYLVNILKPETKSFCSINRVIDCDQVAASSFSEIMGIPVSVLGVFAYLFVTILIVIAFINCKKDEGVSKKYLSFTYFIAWVMMAFCFYELFASVFIIGSICLMCAMLYTLVILMTIFSKMAFNSSHQDIFKSFKDLFSKGIKDYVVLFIIFIISVGSAYGTQTYFFNMFKEEGRIREQREHEEENKRKATMAENYKKSLVTQYFTLQQHELDFSGTPFKGEETAEVIITEFSDLQCPACAVRAKDLSILVEKYSGKVRLNFKNYPLDQNCNANIQRRFHEQACTAAKYALCANEQGKFWEFEKKIFENQKGLSDSFFNSLVDENGLDKGKLSKCLKERADKIIQRDISEGAKIGLRYTPTILINGRVVSDIAKQHGDLEAIIEAILQE
jgi:protein-disulfide isomerase/uncharacterized membrane protein